MSTFRAFISIDIEEDEVIDRIQELQDRLKASGADLKLVEPENVHLTLKFLGDIPESRVSEVVEAMERAADTVEPFTLRLKGLGVFPNIRHIRVVWVGVDEGADETKAMAAVLEDELGRRGFRRERRDFVPHVTIARVRSGRNKAQLVEAIRELSSVEVGDVEVTAIRLKKSILRPEGPEYHTVEEVKL
ncbi:MAG: RNA 2',3'-cyclic phosphodiesterase [Euryarchaeota archaeon]